MTAPPGRSELRCVLLSIAVLSPQIAHASGYLPPMEIENRTFAGINACRAELMRIDRDLFGKRDPSPIPDGDRTKQTLVYTKGLVDQDAGHIVYDVEIGWQFRTPMPDIKQIRNDYSYDRRHYTCDGGHLKGISTQGYTLESYEDMPIEEGAAAKGSTRTR